MSAHNVGSRYGHQAFRLHMVTWNVGTAEPPADVRSLLQLDSQPATDLYVIGLQEVNANPVRYISDLISEDSWSHLLMDTLAPMGYIKVTSVRMQGLLLILFAKQVHLPFIRDIQSTYTRTGLFGYWGNKGGVSVRFSFYGHMLCFLNCHLAAHMNYALQRMDEFEYILDTQDFDMYNTPQVLDHKVVFWFGDLNFRIADHGMHFLRSSISNGRFNLLWNRDQLTMMKKKEAILQEFEEGLLCFKPTYKFDRFSETYDTSGKKRKPAWTDRILWRIKPKAIDTEDENSSTTSSADDEEYPFKMRKKVVTPLVALTVEGHWSADEGPTFTYTILENFESSTWDWIGLYKIGFKSASDYSTFAWVKDDEVAANGEVVTVQMSKSELPLPAGDYVLGYYSTNMQTLIAFSPTFQILESQHAVMEGLLPENINGHEK